MIDFTASFFIITTSVLRHAPQGSSALGREIFCRTWLTNLPVWGVMVSSTYNFVLMTFERFIAIVYPLKLGRKITHGKTYIFMALAWLFGTIYHGTYMVTSSRLNDKGDCTVFTVWPNPTLQKACGVMAVVVSYIVPLSCNTFANIRMAVVLKNQTDINNVGMASDIWKKKMVNAQRNVVKMLLLVFASFVLCWTPNQVYFLLYNLGYSGVDFNSGFYHFTVIAVFCNCCFNPFLYMIKYKPFQEAAKQLLCCHGNKSDKIPSTINTCSSEVSLKTDDVSPRI